MGLQKARLVSASGNPSLDLDVLFNPTEYGIDRGASFAELAIPGLPTPILQFVRGEAQSLSLELFLDRTNSRKSVEDDLAAIRRFVQIDRDLHAPPVCRFVWGKTSFQGVVTSLKEKYTLFSDTGEVLRARVNLSLKSYQSAEVQLRDLKRQSPDRTRVRVLREGETLTQLANEAYGDPRLWRVIAAANDIDRPRFVPPGTALTIPALP
jgi:nucleoid-associated protein YgaU